MIRPTGMTSTRSKMNSRSSRLVDAGFKLVLLLAPPRVDCGAVSDFAEGFSVSAATCSQGAISGVSCGTALLTGAGAMAAAVAGAGRGVWAVLMAAPAPALPDPEPV